MEAYKRLLKLRGHHLDVWMCIEEKIGCPYQKENVCVSYHNCEIKEGSFLIGTFGEGETFEEACENYMEKITGKTLVFNACGNRKEVTVL